MSDRHTEWVRAIELWKSGGAVTTFMEENFPKLKDADGNDLPQIVSEFLQDLMWRKTKPRNGRPLNKADIRKAYKQLMEERKIMRDFAKVAGESDERSSNLRGGESDGEAVKRQIAETWKVSKATIDGIIYPRKRGRKT